MATEKELTAIHKEYSPEHNGREILVRLRNLNILDVNQFDILLDFVLKELARNLDFPIVDIATAQIRKNVREIFNRVMDTINNPGFKDQIIDFNHDRYKINSPNITTNETSKLLDKILEKEPNRLKEIDFILTKHRYTEGKSMGKGFKFYFSASTNDMPIMGATETDYLGNRLN